MNKQRYLSPLKQASVNVRKSGRPLFHKPWLECLEDRLVPATIIVNNLHDSGAGSLRAAIIQANAQAGNDTIAIAAGLNGKLNLRSALPDLSSNIHIIDFLAPGDAGVTVRRGVDSPFRIFTITSGNVVAISGLTISNGQADFGGGIFNDGGLTLTNCTVSGNLAQSGGGIFTSFPMALTNCTVTGNSAYEDGAGILNTNLLTLTNSTVSGNFYGFAPNPAGGGIYNRSTGRLFLNNSTVSGNSSEVGGGIYNVGRMTLTNSTVSGNFAFAVSGIYNAPFGELTVTNTTVSGNIVDNYSAAIGNLGELILNNSIVANSVGPDIISIDNGTVTGSHNLIEDGSGGLADTISGDPRLGPLADNGGPTQTHMLLAGSLAINAGNNTLVPAGVTTDQRRQGFVRKFGGKVDLGAFERQGVPRVFQRSDTLFIVGDREANHIAIAETREGGISVAFDRGDAQVFTGIKQIDLKTFDGDDQVNFVCPSDPSIHFRADLGTGDDKLSISGFDPQPDPPRVALYFDLHGGAGDDSFDLNMMIPPDQQRQEVLWDMRMDLGAGHDRLDVEVQIPPDQQLEDVTWDMNVMMGAGNDHYDLTVAIPPDQQRLEGQWDLRTDLGAGDDGFVMNMGEIELAGKFMMMVAGGAGIDHLVAAGIGPCPRPESEIRISLLGDAGNDLIETSVTGLENEGRFILQANGGAGNDHLVAAVGGQCNLPESELRISLLGDAGDDLIETSVTGRRDGRFTLEANGGSGNDRITARVEVDEDSRGALDVRVFGGMGNDRLKLALYDIPEAVLLTALLDGGRGYDVAHLTRNVRFANCEELYFLDDPK